MGEEPKQPSSEVVIAQIDREIDLLLARQVAPGWSPWALLGACATIVWMGLDLLQGQEVSFQKAGVVAVLTTYFLDLVRGSLGWTQQAAQYGERRYWTAAGLAAQLGLSGSVALLRGLAIAAFVLTVEPGLLTVFGRAFLLSGPALLLLAYLILAAIALLGFFMPKVGGPAKGMPSTIGRLFVCGLFAVGLASVCSSLAGSISLLEIRLGCMAGLVGFLLTLAADLWQSAPLVDELIRIRRGIAFNGLRASEGYHLAQVALLGAGISEVLQRRLARLSYEIGLFAGKMSNAFPLGQGAAGSARSRLRRKHAWLTKKIALFELLALQSVPEAEHQAVHEMVAYLSNALQQAASALFAGEVETANGG